MLPKSACTISSAGLTPYIIRKRAADSIWRGRTQWQPLDDGEDDVGELGLLCILVLIGTEFWQRRRQAELAERLITHYCQREQWQLLSVARDEGELLPLLVRMLLQRTSCFCFEYSEEGEQRLQGELFLTGLQSPLFRVATPSQGGDSPSSASNVIQFPGPRP